LQILIRNDLILVDEVIPQGVINKIYNSAVNAKECKLFVAPQTPHAVFTNLRSNNSESFCIVLRQIAEIFKKLEEAPT
jgi:hypothetical protein